MTVTRKIISDNEGFKTIVELSEISRPSNHVQLKFLTEWDGAKRDGSEQVQYTMILSSEQRQMLKELL
jgi:hypothetical protein